MLTAETLAALQSLYVPAVPDALVLDTGETWQGPIEGYLNHLREWHPMTLIGPDKDKQGRLLAFWHSDNACDPVSCSLGGIRLPLTRPEVRARIVSVMGAGRRCEVCYLPGNVVGHSCYDGYLRPPAPCRHLFADGLGDLPAEMAGEAAGLIACHVARVLAGLGGVVAVLEQWGRPDQWIARHGRAASGFGLTTSGGGRLVHGDGADALLAGFALRTEGGGMVLPWPVLTTPD